MRFFFILLNFLVFFSSATGNSVFAEEPWSISHRHPVTRDAIWEKKHTHKDIPSDSISLIRFYQKYISPLSGPTCHYVPTCSAYTAEAVQKYGLFKGIVMGTDRLIRCHPMQREYPLDPPILY
ncbi:MAG: putative membrane protein insertion efficiency factor [Turneriella sp.]|nr:putative membrane protein insertion efficiency factor [Turneriella sp.]